MKVLAGQLVTSGSPEAVSSLSLSVASLGELLVGAAEKKLASDRIKGAGDGRRGNRCSRGTNWRQGGARPLRLTSEE